MRWVCAFILKLNPWFKCKSCSVTKSSDVEELTRLRENNTTQHTHNTMKFPWWKRKRKKISRHVWSWRCWLFLNNNNFGASWNLRFQRRTEDFSLFFSLFLVRTEKFPGDTWMMWELCLLVQFTATLPSMFRLPRGDCSPISLYYHPCALVSEILHSLGIFSIHSIYSLA